MRFAGLLIVCLASASLARAQDARELFAEGVAAMEAEEYEQARGLFEQAYELSQRPNILVNLGSAQRQLGQLLEARSSYERFLEESEDRQLNRRVDDELAEVVSLIPQLTIRVQNLAGGDVVQVDGNAVEALDEPFELNPGMREVRVMRGERELTSIRVRVEPEGRELVELTVPNVVDPVEVAINQPDPDPDPDPDPRGSNVGVIVGVTVGVIAVAVAVVLAIVLSGGDDPFQGSIPPGSVEVP